MDELLRYRGDMDVWYRRRTWLRPMVFVALLAPAFIETPAYAASRSVEIQVTLVVLPGCAFPSAAALAAGALPQCAGGAKPTLSYTRESLSTLQAESPLPAPMIAAFALTAPSVARSVNDARIEPKNDFLASSVPDLDIAAATAGENRRGGGDEEALLVTVNF